MELKKHTYIYLSPRSWYEQLHRKPLIKAIARHPEVERVYVIEVPADMIHAPLMDLNRIRHAIKSFFNVSQEGENLYVFTPFIFLHHLIGFRIPLIRQLNIWLFNLSMRRMLRKEQIDSPVIFSVYRPDMLDFASFYKDLFLVYDCYDEYLLTSDDKKIENLIHAEKKLMQESNVIFATADKLAQKALKFNKNSYFIPNAADVELFGQAYTEVFEAPADMENIKQPIIGYVGALRDWQDFELLDYVIEKHPDKSFVFVGGFRKSALHGIKRLKKYGNVFFLGEKVYNDLPAYLKHMDVVIIPNKMNQFNQSVLPIKLFEYMAAGKKILATNTSDDLKKYYSDYINVANNAREFSEKLNLLLNEKTINSKAIYEFGIQQSWTSRVDTMMKLISKSFNKY